jgi:hypothetical protein
MIEHVVYVLCAATALLCAIFLFRQWRRTGVPLILWAGIAFAFFTLNNLALIVDFTLLPEKNLTYIRQGLNLAGAMSLIIGILRNHRHA